MKQISIGFSPCPNDTFIFDALVNGRIPTGNYQFVPHLADVEELNKMAAQGVLDITKISVAAYPAVSERYIILESGSALGKGVGPIVVSKSIDTKLNFDQVTAAIPGLHTTANLLLSIFYPNIKQKKEVIFSEIEEMVCCGLADLGLLIHEGRFTYRQKGLALLADLGEAWEQQYQKPLPLGCICASRNLEQKEAMEIGKLIKESVQYAYAHPEKGSGYIRKHAQEMNDEVIRQHIGLYVNEYSIALGPEGRESIELLLREGALQGSLPETRLPIFITEVQ